MITPISGVFLALIAVLSYFVLMKVFQTDFTNKRKRLSSFLQEEQKQKENKITEWLEKRGINHYVNPSHMIQSAQKCGVHITKQSYISTFLLGTALGVVVMLVYFKPVIFLMPVSIVGGFIATNMRLHNIKKNFIQELDSKLAVYMSSVATAMGTFSNTKDALNSVLPLLEFPVKEDLEEALLKLQDGKSIKYSFDEMNKKYEQKQVKLFHEQLDVVARAGSGDIESLRTIANKMKSKEVRRRRLKTAHRQSFKAWRTFAFLCLSAPFLFLLASTDNYFLVMNHFISSIVFGITFLLIFITYRKLEQLELYDPTNDQKVDLS